MAYPLTSETGNLTTDSTVTTGDLYYLFGTALRMTTDLATLNLEANEIEVTQATGSAINMHERINGLRTGTVEFSGIWPRTTTPLGISSSVVYTTPANGYTQYVNSWNLEVTWPEIDITYFAGGATGPTDPSTSWRRWMPGGIGMWSGSYTCKADDATAPLPPSTGASTQVTFKFVEDGATDPNLVGNITTPRLVQRVRLGDFSELTYNFSGSGNLTQTAGTSLPGLLAASGTIGKPTWNITATDSKPDNLCVLTVATGRLWKFPAFWTRLGLSWKVDDVVRVTGTLRIADVPTVLG
jgi:hypothetical protein